MSTEEILSLAEQIVKSWDWATEVSRPKTNQLNVKVNVLNELLPIVVGLRVKRLGYLSAIVGVDLGPQTNEIEVLYYFCPGDAVIVLRACVPHQNGTLQSLSEIVASAEVFERELREMFGIEITGLHETEHLYLPDDWPDGIYPLRKDFEPTIISAQTEKA